MKKFIYKMFLIFACLSFFACEQNEEPNYSVLLGTWELNYVEDIVADTILNFPDTIQTKVKIIITDSSYVLLSGVCNSGTGKYEILNGSNIYIYDICLTEMGCVIGHYWDKHLYKLTETNSYYIDHNELVFELTDVKLFFIKTLEK
jgi:heat shock protein HslJ